MFVRIEVKYIWYGNNIDVSFVGPFQDKATADKWSEEFNALARRGQLTAKSDFTPGHEPGKLVHPTAKAPQVVLSETIESIEEVCRG